MPSRRLIGLVLATVLLSSTACGQGMSIGGGAYDSVDPFSSDPFAATTGDFGMDDPAEDGPAFTGQDALAMLREVNFIGEGLPDGFEVMTVDEAGPSGFDRAQGAVGELRLRLGGQGSSDGAVVWRAYGDSGSAVAALPQLVQSVGQRFRGSKVEELHPSLGEDGFTCALVRPAEGRVNVTCGLSIGLDPLQALAIVDASVANGRNQAQLVEQAARLAAWARDRWVKIESERRNG